MNLKVLLVLILYYALISMFFTLGGSYVTGFNTSVNFNTSNLAAEEKDTGGLFSTGVSFARYFALVTFGIGLPSDTPGWFQVIFALWETILTIFTIGFIISSIWNG